MIKFFIGLVLGLVLSVAACYLLLPGVTKNSYDTGYDAGNKKGISTGTTAGYTQCVAETKALQKRQADSVAIAEKNQEAAKKTMHRPRKVVKEVQNWHVIDGKLADPIAN